MPAKSNTWELTWQGVIATLLVTVFCLTPFVALLALGINSGSLILAGFLILSFWFPAYKVIRLSLASKKLPIITGGPSFSTGWQRERS